MLTTSHAILNSTLLGRKTEPQRYWPLILGALLPDIPGFLNAVWKTVQAASNHWTWDDSYYSAAWMPWVDWAHSIPLAITLTLLCLLFRSQPGLYFSLSMFLHDVEDLFVHSIKSHHHFLPFSDYRFISPISCGEPQFHAAFVVPAEWALVVGCCFLLWKRHPSPWLKWGLIFICAAQGFGALYFVLVGQFH